jgi:alkylation response protein AidB-like acyl-CoA dehydrogenase
MDFSLSEDQLAIAELASQILTDKASNERQREIERADGPRFDDALWEEVAKAGLLGIPVPEVHGGAGLGFLEVAAILEHVGRHTAPIPILETLVLGALPLARFGSEAQQAAWLPRVATGDAVLTAALDEDSQVRAEPEGDGWRLHGTCPFVPAAALADAVAIPARTAAGPAFFLVDAKAEGLQAEALLTTSGLPESKLTLDGVRVGAADLLGAVGEGDRIAAWIGIRARSAACMVALGACRAALDLTSDYIKTRKQFDQPLAMFQAVGHRAADAYVDTEAITLTAWQAAWRLDAGLDAEKQVAVAKFFAAEAGKRVVHAAQHLHGGVGVDREYPLHRFFLYARHLELVLGRGTEHLLTLGRLLAADGEPARA